MVRTAMLALLPLVLANWTQPDDNIHRISDAAEIPETGVDASDQAALREMRIGLYYISKLNYVAAVNRFKTVVTRYQASPYVQEALARLAETYLGLLSEPGWAGSPGIASEAQTAVAVLDRKFPTGHFSIEAHDALKSAGFEPVENEKSWISRAFK